MRIALLILFFACRCFGVVLPANGLRAPLAVAPGPYGGTSALIGWYDFNGLSNSVDGTTVGRWLDNSYAHNDLSNNATVSKWPLWTNSIISKFPCVYFDGVDDYLQTKTNQSYAITNATILVVARTNSWNTGFIGCITQTNAENSQSIEWFIGGGGTNPESDAAHGGPNGNYYISSYTNNIRGSPAWVAAACQWGVATNDTFAWWNSVVANNNTQVSGTPVAFTENLRLLVLANRSTLTYPAPLQLVEMLVYNRKLSDSERFFLEQYFRHKYGSAKIP